MFRVLGVLVLVYVCYALSRGEVFAKHRWSSRRVLRQETPGYFSAVIAIYTILGVALLIVF
jgi:ABC-type maltose transport system permease subunit